MITRPINPHPSRVALPSRAIAGTGPRAYAKGRCLPGGEVVKVHSTKGSTPLHIVAIPFSELFRVTNQNMT